MLPYGLPSFVFSPRWFYGFDSLIELIGVIVCGLLVYYSYKCYKLTSEHRYLYFSTAFLSLTLAFVAKVAGTFAIYTPPIRESGIGRVVQTTFSALTLSKINGVAFLLYIFLTLLGFMILFLIVSKLTWENKRVIAMLLYFVLVATWLGVIHYQLFYVTTFAMLSLITLSYFKNYEEIKSKNSMKVVIAFGILLVSHAFFVFVIYFETVYVIAEMIQLLGFLFLLIPFISVFRKKPNNYKLVK